MGTQVRRLARVITDSTAVEEAEATAEGCMGFCTQCFPNRSLEHGEGSVGVVGAPYC